MSKLLSIVAGWTKELEPFDLTVDGAPLRIDPSWVLGLVIRCVLTDAVVPTAGRIRADADQDAYPGRVYYKPQAADYDPPENGSAYTFRWEVSDVEASLLYVPNGAPDTITVYKP